MKTKRSLTQWAVLCWIAAFGSQLMAAPMGTAFTYQGKLTSGTNAANGVYDFSFAVFNAASGPTQQGPTLATNAVSVSNGYFVVTLDFGNVFPGEARWLDISVKTNGAGSYTTLTPRQQLTPMPYAIMANNASNVLGTVPAAQLSGTVANSQLADNSVTTAKILDATILGADMANNTVTSFQLADDVELGSISANGELTLWSDANNIESLRLYGATHTIDIYDNSGDRTVSLNGGGASGGAATLWGPDGTLRANLQGSSSGASILLRDSTATATVQARGDLGGRVDVADSFRVSTALGGTLQASLERISGGGRLVTYDEAGTTTGYFGSSGTAGGFVELHTGTSALGLRLDGDDGGAGLVSVNGANGLSRIALDGNAGDGGGTISVRNTNSLERVLIDGQANGGGGEIIIYAGDGASGVRIYGDSGGAGAMYLYNTNGTSRLSLDGFGTSGGGQIYGYANDGSTTLNLRADNGSGAGLIEVRNNLSSTRVSLFGENAYNGGEVRLKNTSAYDNVILNADSYGGGLTLYDADGDATALLKSASAGGAYQYFYKANTTSLGLYLDGDAGNSGYLAVYGTNGSQVIILDGQSATGSGRVVTEEIQITGGADLSENFDIQGQNAPPEPGMVVCIDPAHPGELRLSTEAYDRTVAGIISGAGGVRPGMLMGHLGTKADGKHPVALTGRVYCQADASNGPIQPGDLLTTSSTPGHAMKVTDHAKAQGTIIGKAMTELKQGRGLVLVLVSLQ